MRFPSVVTMVTVSTLAEAIGVYAVMDLKLSMALA